LFLKQLILLPIVAIEQILFKRSQWHSSGLLFQYGTMLAVFLCLKNNLRP
jgi:hypothetical protein